VGHGIWRSGRDNRDPGSSVPAAVAAARTDELWRHTCFEAFVRTSPAPAYYEFNFAPSTQWAAYRFDIRCNALNDLLPDRDTNFAEVTVRQMHGEAGQLPVTEQNHPGFL
jgi:hypothetical protein